MPKMHGKCERCGKAMEFWPSQRRRFCSGHCKAMVQHQRMRDGGKPLGGSKPRKGDEFACAMCKRTFYRAPAQIDRGRQYCSVKCADASKIKGSTVKSCAYCGEAMYCKPSQVMRLFCSRECYTEGQIRRPLERTHNGRRARMTDDGYVYVYEPDHPKAHHGWVFEHRLVVEQSIGRYLEFDEHVHHKNGVKDDNRLENLEVMAKADHNTLTVSNYREKVNQAFADLAELAEYRRRFGNLT